MTFTSEVTFASKIKPFSEQFNVAMRGLAADVNMMSQYMPAILHLIKRAEVGEGGGVAAFPAKVLQGTTASGI